VTHGGRPSSWNPPINFKGWARKGKFCVEARGGKGIQQTIREGDVQCQRGGGGGGGEMESGAFDICPGGSIRFLGSNEALTQKIKRKGNKKPPHQPVGVRGRVKKKRIIWGFGWRHDAPTSCRK